MIGLCEMAARLAEQRREPNRRFPSGIRNGYGGICPAPREYAEMMAWSVPCSAEYYRIIDRLALGKKP